MNKLNLIKLMERLQRENLDVNLIKAEGSGIALRLFLDLERGFGGYEELTATLKDKKVTAGYTGLASLAFDTFLNPKYILYINGSALLKRFKERVEGLDVAGKFEVYDKTRKEFYSQLVGLEEAEDKWQEIEKAFFYLNDIFRIKAGK